jgi:outer membrane protein
MYGVDVAELAVKFSEGALYPNLGLTASYTQSYDTQPQTLRQTNVSILGRLTVPIYQGGAEYSAIRQSKETLGQQRLNLDVNRDQARATVVQSWGQLDAARAQIEATTAQVPVRFAANPATSPRLRKPCLTSSRVSGLPAELFGLIA